VTFGYNFGPALEGEIQYSYARPTATAIAREPGQPSPTFDLGVHQFQFIPQINFSPPDARRLRPGGAARKNRRTMMSMNRVPATLVDAVEAGLLPRGAAVLLAVSGGADSMALLHGAAEVAGSGGWSLSVGHVHHGWRGREADRDLRFVEEHARRLDLPFASRLRDARAASRTLGLSPEAGARLVRYEALHEMARSFGARAIATAHQQDDLLESHLLALRRRGGLALLAGPRTVREDGVVRPLLQVPRREILAFLASRGIGFRRDASNGDLRLLRNRVRREIAELPLPERDRLASEVARLQALRDRLERELAERVLPRVRFSPTASVVEGAFLASVSDELARAALERLAAPFARPGRPPMTGRERERVLELLARGRDFHFEAGRRICLEQRRGILIVRPRTASGRAPVYDPAKRAPAGHEDREITP
jgi:tRNA(Ile)-lysidine synthetase-like protein